MNELSYKIITDPKDTSWTGMLPHYRYSKQKGPKHDKYCLVENLIASFDIEVSNIGDIDHLETVFALPYSYQFMLYNLDTKEQAYFQFRHPHEIAEFFDKTLRKALKIKSNAYIYTGVHNLNYEFTNTLNTFYYNEQSAFFNGSKRRINHIRTTALEMHDTYQIKPTKLEYIGNELNIPKGKNYDYDKIRTPLTPLTKEELDYCYRDVYIVVKFLEKELEQEKSIKQYPITQTGKTRRVFKRVMNLKKNKKYKDYLQKQKVDYDSYISYRQAYYGGFTHANPDHTGKLIENVQAVDAASMYPHVLISETYPVGEIHHHAFKSREHLLSIYEKYCFWGTFEFTNIRTFSNHPVIYKSPHHEGENLVYENGKLVSADKLRINLLDKDFIYILQQYKFDNLYNIGGIYTVLRGKLPKPIIELLLELFGDKTSYKGIVEMIIEYNLAKIYINSVYGMTATDIIRDEFELRYGTIYKIQRDKHDALDDIKEFNNSKSRYLSPYWGAYVTMHARHMLLDIIDEIDDDFVYCDTDSIYSKGDLSEIVGRKNKEIVEHLDNTLRDLDIDINLSRPKDKSGKRRQLGIWEYENDCPYLQFKTLGAKRYLKQTKDGKFKLTHSGIPKDVVKYIMQETVDGKKKKTGFDFYNEYFEIPAKYSGKLGKKYIEEHREGDIVDYKGIKYHYSVGSGLYLYPIAFTSDLIKKLDK